MNKIILSFFLFLFSTLTFAENDNIILTEPSGKPVKIEHQLTKWHKIANYDDKEFWIAIDNIETAKPDNEHDLRRVFGMIRIISESKKVPGIGEGVRRVYSEAVVNCFDGAVIAVKDFYTDDDGYILGIHTHRVGKSVVYVKGTKGTMASAVHNFACLNQLPD